jgi:hypothetical protein
MRTEGVQRPLARVVIGGLFTSTLLTLLLLPGLYEWIFENEPAECLNTHWFMDLKEAKQLIETWRREYNVVSYCPTSLCG